MKVLHIITRMNTGGPAVFLDHLTNAMSDLSAQSTIAHGYCESNETDLSTKLMKVKDEVNEMFPSKLNYYRLTELKNGLN